MVKIAVFAENQYLSAKLLYSRKREKDAGETE
jgi:hypothetical protein